MFKILRPEFNTESKNPQKKVDPSLTKSFSLEGLAQKNLTVNENQSSLVAAINEVKEKRVYTVSENTNTQASQNEETTKIKDSDLLETSNILEFPGNSNKNELQFILEKNREAKELGGLTIDETIKYLENLLTLKRAEETKAELNTRGISLEKKLATSNEALQEIQTAFKELSETYENPKIIDSAKNVLSTLDQHSKIVKEQIIFNEGELRTRSNKIIITINQLNTEIKKNKEAFGGEDGINNVIKFEKFIRESKTENLKKFGLRNPNTLNQADIEIAMSTGAAGIIEVISELAK